MREGKKSIINTLSTWQYHLNHLFVYRKEKISAPTQHQHSRKWPIHTHTCVCELAGLEKCWFPHNTNAVERITESGVRYVV